MIRCGMWLPYEQQTWGNTATDRPKTADKANGGLDPGVTGSRFDEFQIDRAVSGGCPNTGRPHLSLALPFVQLDSEQLEAV
jgi:hypothetical protein